MVHNLEWDEICDTIDFGSVGRVQVNSTEADEKAMLKLWRFGQHIGKPIVMQWREDTFPSAVPGVHLLQDRSGGRGVEETKWARPDAGCAATKTFIGYAGGLGPDNIAFAMKSILRASAGRRFWVDCESNLRTNDWFDQAKAEQMAEAVYWALPEMFQDIREVSF
jgi:phosphoribosylanthranilate isomerase